MSPKVLLVFLAAVTTTGVLSQPDPSVCTLHGPEVGPPLPLLPQQYILRIEANIEGWNQTIEVKEFYDAVNNRGLVANTFKGRISQTLMDYDTQEIITVGSDGSCMVRNLTANGFNVYGFRLENGSAHIGGVSDIFRFGSKYNDTYMNQTRVRGIPADHWQSCWYDELNNGTSLLSYYFTVPGYYNAFGDEQVPLRLVLEGRASNHKFIDGHIQPVPGFHSYQHVYEFFDVQFKPEFDDRTFEPWHSGVLCPGRKSLKPIPGVPDHFRQQLEIVYPETKSVFYMSEVYNYKSKVAAYDYSAPSNTVPGQRIHYHSVDDFNTGLTYRINMTSGHCNITPISTQNADAFTPDNIHVQLNTAAGFLHIVGELDWEYQGVTILREIETESWIAERNDWVPWGRDRGSGNMYNSTWEFFFTTSAWKIESGFKNSSSIPVMTRIRWRTNATLGNSTDPGAPTNDTAIVNYFHFTADRADISQFDLSPCFGKANRLDLAFDIKGDNIYRKYIANNSIDFYYGVADSIAEAALVTPTRISNVFASEGSNGKTTVFFSLLGIPQIQGDALNATKQPTLDQAYAHLTIQSNGFILTFNHNGEMIQVYSEPNLRNATNPNSPQPLNEGPKLCILWGVLVTLGIVLLAAAAVVGYMKCKKKDFVPYNVQE